MIKVFLEYKINENSLLSYQSVMQEVKDWMIQKNIRNYQHFEGADQPLLFVEMFDVFTLEEYEKIKKLRCEEEVFFEEYVFGGKEKIHMWAFKETSYVK